MAFNSTDWTINYTNSTVTNDDSGTGTNLPINFGDNTYVGDIGDFFRWLADDFSSGDTMEYGYPINAVTPTVYEWTNGWGFGDDNNDYKYLYGGSIVSSGLTELWTNLYSLGTQNIGSRLYVIQGDEEIEPWWITGNIDFLIKVKEGGTFIQSRDADGVLVDGSVWIYCREFGDTFDHNFIDLSAGGRNPTSINNADDPNNISGEIYISVSSAVGFSVDKFIEGGTSGAIGKIEKISSNDIYLNSVSDTFVISETITEYNDREATDATGQSTTNNGVTAFTSVMSDFDNISITFGSVTKDLDNGAGLRPYEVVIDCSGETLDNVYEYLKYVVRYRSSGATYTIQGDAGQEYRNASGSTWIDVKIAPFGSFAGGKFFGARGVFIENMSGADLQNYQLIDSENEPQLPPEQYSLTLTNLQINSEIRIFTGSTNEIAGVENSTDTFTYNYFYVGDELVDIVIHNLGYVYIRLYDYLLTNQNSSLPIQQQKDRWFDNPS